MLMRATETTRLDRAWPRRLKLAIIALTVLLLSACAQSSVETPPDMDASATAEPSPTEHVFPTLRPTETPDLSTSQACIDCHSDRQRLIETADQSGEQKVESTGEG